MVDTGLNATEGAKLLAKVRQVSSLPIQYIVNTHYHPDHQGGKSVAVGRNAVVLSTEFTRGTHPGANEESGDGELSLPAGRSYLSETSYRAPGTVYRGSVLSGRSRRYHMGDALVYFPDQHAIAMGDLFLNRSCPAMDDGSVASWIQALDQVLALPVESVVPGHFDLGTRSDLTRFRDYLNDLFHQVRALKQKGETLEQVRHDIHLEKYSDFRQYPRKFEATFGDNATTVYQQLASALRWQALEFSRSVGPGAVSSPALRTTSFCSSTMEQGRRCPRLLSSRNAGVYQAFAAGAWSGRSVPAGLIHAALAGSCSLLLARQPVIYLALGSVPSLGVV